MAQLSHLHRKSLVCNERATLIRNHGPVRRTAPFSSLGTLGQARDRVGTSSHPVRAVETAQATDSAPKTGAKTDPKILWFEQWYPVYPIEYLDDLKKPYKVDLLGLSMVVWNNGDKEGDTQGWHCFEDRCPHRFAPLSEGLIDGKDLTCAYHGWQFEASGKCTKVPQISDPKAHAYACNSKHSCAVAYPVKVAHGLLWVWPQPSMWAGAKAAASPPANLIPELTPGTPEATESKWRMRTQWVMRDLPLRYDTLMENVLDPSHVAFAHHGVQGNRKRPMQSDQELKDGSVTLEKGFTVLMPPFRPNSPRPFFSFRPPALASYDMGIGKMEVYVVPTKVGWSRLIAGFLISDRPIQMPAPVKLFLKALFAVESVPFLEHPLIRNAVLDGDTFMLHVAERKLLQQTSGKRDWAREYYAPARCDISVSTFHSWMRRFGGDVPTCSDAESVLMPPEMPKEQVLNRWEQHTRHCKHCLQALKTVDFLSAASQAVGLATLFVFTARAVAAHAAASAQQACAEKLKDVVLAAAQPWMAGVLLAVVLLYRVLQGYRQKLFYEEYEHSHKDV